MSSSWTPEGNLFVSDEFGSVWLMAIEANKLYSVVKSKMVERPKNKPIVVTHKNGVIFITTNSEITVRIDESLIQIKFLIIIRKLYD